MGPDDALVGALARVGSGTAGAGPCCHEVNDFVRVVVDGAVGAMLCRGATDEPWAAPVAPSRAGGPAECAYSRAFWLHRHDFDSYSPEAGGHPATVCLAAALAVAEFVDASGSSVVAAYARGIQLSVALRQMLDGPELACTHISTALGRCGAAVTAGALLGLGDDDLGRAATYAVWIGPVGRRDAFGSALKPLQLAGAVRAGVEAALHVAGDANRRPATPPIAPCDGDGVLCRTPSRLKEFPVCGYFLPTLESLRRLTVLVAMPLDSATVLVPKSVLARDVLASPTTLEQCRFSLRGVVAAVLLAADPLTILTDEDRWRDFAATGAIGRVQIGRSQQGVVTLRSGAADAAIDASVPLVQKSDPATVLADKVAYAELRHGPAAGRLADAAARTARDFATNAANVRPLLDALDTV